ncbi:MULTISPECIES: hypothetical protein [Nesterenkonia]|uniref:Uncharacterized protein n=1 Tax=Nesterenkonia xinjiangensis TaxID=225327 RepID=A0A7Z0GPD0_9MICC|nr:MULTISPECIES: hypothetical protein [Nesterenkonia]MDZ5075990.1 hypothetical protein [Nesterenkonia sp. HG001]NYJ79239.1 hypothetical protein [Nesterenkonia xinjiangensis]
MTRHRDDDPSAIFSRRGSSRPVSGSGPGPRDWSVDEDSLDEIDDFRPPNPKSPLAGAKPAVVLGVVLAVGGLLALLLLTWLPMTIPSWAAPALIGVTLVGLVTLFLQMPRSRTGSGDGAQV